MNAPIETALAARLMPGPVSEDVAPDHSPPVLRAEADYHGVTPLIAASLVERDDSPTDTIWLEAFPAPSHLLAEHAVLEALRARELRRVLCALAEAGVESLILKGAALAYRLYAAPALRPRADTDLLIRAGDRAALDATLERLGYRWPNAVEGRFVTYQRTAVRVDDRGATHRLDVHWKLSNFQLFAGTLGFESLKSRALAIPTLGDTARGLGNVDALLHACMHRASHVHAPYYAGEDRRLGANRLIWLYDIHLLAGRLAPAEWNDLATLAERHALRSVCLAAFEAAGSHLGTAFPVEIHRRLGSAHDREASAGYLMPGALRFVFIEFVALARWRDRLAWVSEHLFPPASYMLEKYGTRRRSSLPTLYLRRGMSAARRLARFERD